MENYNRMVIDLYKSAVGTLATDGSLKQDLGMGELTAIANAITVARVNGEETSGLERLRNDVEHLRIIADSL